ncbi:DNA replication complex GINS protein PSF2 [Exaiptasia diaphana]|uniref:DNA replication complex GINS protein PSF2 n=1 Tax=Exaiptasia diaphana TaxID=2652724 RepID=A0A913WS73_EXADI|nr:DNA replication complex GINS protein PSF2 [Exaiptasia diaphana]XP_020893310.1 DNA replication complex GINS protein PSF2 [Exaiptasia diaphana]
MDPGEIEFLAEKEHVTILPNFTEKKIFLIGGDIGPFNASLPVDVPLWIAINLKQRKKCRIQAPDWMEIDKLKELKEEETKEEYFIRMPSNFYMEIATLLLNCATDDIPHADEVRTLIKDIWDIRIAKLRKSIDLMISQQAVHARLDDLTLMEINTVRLLLTKSLDHLHTLRCHAAENPPTES